LRSFGPEPKLGSEDIQYAKDMIGIYAQCEKKLSELRNEDQLEGVEQEIFLKLIERGDPVDSLVPIFGRHTATLHRWKNRLSHELFVAHGAIPVTRMSHLCERDGTTL